MKTFSELVESLKEAKISRGYRSGGMPTGDERASGDKPLMKWLTSLEKELKKKRKSYDDVNADDAIKLYNKNIKPAQAAKDLLSGREIKEAETLHWDGMHKNEKEELLSAVRLPSRFAKDTWRMLDRRAKEKLGKYVSKSTAKEFRLDEEELTPAQKKKKEEIILSMKKKEDEFKERYGDEWKSVMYATATKMAKESTKLDETVPLNPHWWYDDGTPVPPGYQYDRERDQSIPDPEHRPGTYPWDLTNPIKDRYGPFKPYPRYQRAPVRTESIEQLDEAKSPIKSLGKEAKAVLAMALNMSSDDSGVVAQDNNLEYFTPEAINKAIKFLDKNSKKLSPAGRHAAREIVRAMKESVEIDYDAEMQIANYIHEARKGKPAPLPKATNFAIRMPIKNKKHDIELAKIVGVETDRKGLVQTGRKEGDSYVFYFKNARDRTKFRDKYLRNEEMPATNTGGVSGLTPDTVGVKKKKKKKGHSHDPRLFKEENLFERRARLEKSIRALNGGDGSDRRFTKEYCGHPVFKVSEAEFNKCKNRRRKNERWSKFFESDSQNVSAIKKYAHRNPRKPVVIQNELTGEIAMLRRRMNDGRLKHNRGKKK